MRVVEEEARDIVCEAGENGISRSNILMKTKCPFSSIRIVLSFLENEIEKGNFIFDGEKYFHQKTSSPASMRPLYFKEVCA